MLKLANLVIVFILELLMFAIYAWYGFNKPTNTIIRVAFSVLLVLVAIILWGILAAPKSKYRLPMPYLAVFRAIMFLSAALFVYLLGYRQVAIIMSAMIVITQTISYFTEK